MCYPSFQICSTFHINEKKKKKKNAFSLDFTPLCKKMNFLLVTPPKHMQTLLFY